MVWNAPEQRSSNRALVGDRHDCVEEQSSTGRYKNMTLNVRGRVPGTLKCIVEKAEPGPVWTPLYSVPLFGCYLKKRSDHCVFGTLLVSAHT